MRSECTSDWINHLVRLREDAKYRHAKARIMVPGFHLIQELMSGPAPLKLVRLATTEVFRRGERMSKFDNHANVHRTISEKQLRFVTKEARSDGILAEFMLPHWEKPRTVAEKKQILIAYGIKDPHNLGMLARTISCLGWDGLGILDASVDCFNYKALRASRGAILHTPIFPVTTDDIMEWTGSRQQHQVKFYLADKFSREKLEFSIVRQPESPISPNYGLLLLVGSEAQGIANLDERIIGAASRISIETTGSLDSLNVAVAAGILMNKLSMGPPILVNQSIQS